MHPTAHVPLPDLAFRDGTPVSGQFDDVYFSRAGGIAETEYVFLKGNGLPERFKNLHIDVHPSEATAEPRQRQGSAPEKREGGASPPSIKNFTIGELGFGTGLNFLVAWREWLRTSDPHAQLHYISVEKYPLTPDQLRAALALQPELSELAAQLLAAYPLRLPGLHRIHLPRVTLTLGFGDAAELLPQLVFPNFKNVPSEATAEPRSGGVSEAKGQRAPSINAFFLDGFAPAKNPDMWDDQILNTIGHLSAPDASFATFTAAGSVRRGLTAQGFTVQKIPGFGHKREMLVGKKHSDIGIMPINAKTEPYNTEVSKGVPRTPSTDAALPSEATAEPRSGGSLGVISSSGAPALIKNQGSRPAPREAAGSAQQRGEGPLQSLILGAGIAGATAARALAERGHHVTVLERSEIGSGASGNEAAVLFPQLSKRWTPAAAWYFAAYSYALQQLARWQEAGLDAPATQCGMLRLPRYAEEETQLRQLNETLGLDPAIAHWIERAEASAIAGLDLPTGAAYFPNGTWLNPNRVCAALLQHKSITVHTNTPVTALTREDETWRAATASGAIFEAPHCILATAHDTAALAPNHGLKLNQVAGQVSLFAARDTATPLRSILCRTGYIIPAGEHLLVGATYNHPATDANFRAVTEANHAHNKHELETLLPHWLTGNATSGRTSIRATTPDRLSYIGELDHGLWVTAGHGSRGMLSAPLAAEIIASAIHGEAAPVATELLAAVNPHRFKNKALNKAQ